MKYMGSKSRLSKFILPIMLEHRYDGQWWVEPFVGGGNVIDKVTGNRLGTDINPMVIQALISIRDHIDELPRNNMEFTEADYKDVRNHRHAGYLGHVCSFSGKWLGGWARGRSADYVKEAYNSARKQSPLLQGVKLFVSDYSTLQIPDNSIIYCDPPYQSTTGYKTKFDHMAFFNWCRYQSSQGHTVYLSEYEAPSDFTCVYAKPIQSYIRRSTSNTSIEKLFLVKK